MKESNYWEVPYRFDHPVGLQFIDGDLPDDFNMLDKTYASVKDCFCDLEEDFENSNAENDGVNEKSEKEGKEEEEEYKEENFEGEEEEKDLIEEEMPRNGKFPNPLVEKLHLYT